MKRKIINKFSWKYFQKHKPQKYQYVVHPLLRKKKDRFLKRKLNKINFLRHCSLK